MSDNDSSPSLRSTPVHVVATRHVRPGCEAAFQDALRDFFQESYRHPGVVGASMIVPPPGSGSSEIGILRTFTSEEARDEFFDSPLFKAWEEKTAPLTEEGWTYRNLSGMEAWFRSPQGPPPRWKMALLTWLAVWPVTMAVRTLLLPLLGPTPPTILSSGVVAAGVVVVLTWVAMPLLVKAARNWLRPPAHPTFGATRRHASKADRVDPV
jgi:antibiotic biosynthesis monooxygenase (ABM) superfamily enzyme